MILTILSLILKYCFLFSENKMLAALLTIEPEKVYAMPDPTLPDDDFKLMATLSDLADRELVATIGWAKQVPGKDVSLQIPCIPLVLMGQTKNHTLAYLLLQ